MNDMPARSEQNRVSTPRRPEDVTVLIVDDEVDITTYLSAVLEDAGMNVVVAHDGDQALDAIRHRIPDLISLDLVMPRKSGHKLLYELRKDKQLSRIPVLIVTAHARDELGKSDLDDIMENRVISGPGVYLEKPIKPLDYVRCVQRAVGIEESEEVGDKISLQQQLQQQLSKAEPHALRRALEPLKKKSPKDD